MCGFAGYKALQPGLTGAVSSLQAVADSLVHRGPQGQGIWIDEQHTCALVHRRLKIVDLSEAGAQPMMDDQQQIVLIYNGEIYNHRQLRAQLEQLGYVYRSQTDSETIIYAYKAWGIGCLDKFKGMFAFALYDRRTNELFLVRDNSGVKPLYFSLVGGYCSFASEIKALWQLPWLCKSLNFYSLSHYLTFLVTPAPFTLYQGIYKVPAGNYVHVNGQGQVRVHQWYTPLRLLMEQGYSMASEQEHVTHIRSLLRQSVQMQTMADVPYGVFLSGGIDSSLITAMLSEHARVKTFTIASSDGPEHNELQWARQVARHFSTEHHEIEITEQDAFNAIDTMVHHQDEPLADCVCIPLYYVAQLLKKSGVTVVQVGEGSDELFCGYHTYAQYLTLHGYYTAAQKIPGVIKKGVYEVMQRILPFSSSRKQMLHSWVHNRHFFWAGALGFSPLAKQQLMQPLFGKQDPVIGQLFPSIDQTLDSYDWVSYHLKELYKNVEQADFLTSIIYLELMHRLPELLLTRVDKMTMISSVEARVPFLDHELVEYALTIPAHFKYRRGTTKYILKQVARGILPDQIIDRPKMGFAAPTKRWFKEGAYFKQSFADMLSRADSWSTIFDKKMIRQLFERHQSTQIDCSLQLWVLYNLMSVPL